ncbi:MAG: 3-oxoacyl-ACP reductase FabG [Chloroflexota bacterium]
MPLLGGKRVLVTGGSRGIGAAIVSGALEEGADVAFVYRSDVDAAETLSRQMEVRFPTQRCLAVQCDVTDTLGMRQVIQDVIQAFGTVDVLVNNAGIARDSAIARMERGEWDEVMATNLGGMFNATQPLVLRMVKQRAGAIINLTSIVGIYGSSGQASYATSKAGIIGFTKALSKELAEFGVRVNAVAPGFVTTDMISGMSDDRSNYLKSRIPVGRLGTVDEVANVVCFLASDKASYITGQIIQVDGGLTW